MNESYSLKATETFSVILVAVSAFLVGTAVTGFAGVFLRSVGVNLESTTVRLGLSVVLLQGVSFGGVAYFYLRLRGLGLDFIDRPLVLCKEAYLRGFVAIRGYDCALIVEVVT